MAELRPSTLDDHIVDVQIEGRLDTPGMGTIETRLTASPRASRA